MDTLATATKDINVHGQSTSNRTFVYLALMPTLVTAIKSINVRKLDTSVTTDACLAPIATRATGTTKPNVPKPNTSKIIYAGPVPPTTLAMAAESIRATHQDMCNPTSVYAALQTDSIPSMTVSPNELSVRIVLRDLSAAPTHVNPMPNAISRLVSNLQFV